MEGQEAAIIHYRDDETMYVEAKAYTLYNIDNCFSID